MFALFTLFLAYLVRPSLGVARAMDSQTLNAQPDNQLCHSYQDAQRLLDDNGEAFEAFIGEVGKGDGLYTDLRLTAPNIGVLGYGVYYSPTGQDIEIAYQLYSPESQDQFIGHILLINEQQYPIEIDGEQHLQWEVTAAPETLQSYAIPLPDFADGVYDIVLLRIYDSQETPGPLGQSGVSSQRLTMVVGEGQPETLPYERLEASTTHADMSMLLGLFARDEDLRFWNAPEPSYIIGMDEDLTFNVRAGYSGSTNPDVEQSQLPPTSRFALVAFINGQQVPISAEQEVLYVEVGIETPHSLIPFSLSTQDLTPDEPHILLVARINHPRTPFCLMQDPADGVTLDYATKFIRVVFELDSSR